MKISSDNPVHVQYYKLLLPEKPVFVIHQTAERVSGAVEANGLRVKTTKALLRLCLLIVLTPEKIYFVSSVQIIVQDAPGQSLYTQA